SAAVLPLLVVGYALTGSRARTAGPVFSLGKLESIEMDRAILLYGRVSSRLEEIQRTCSAVGTSLLVRYQSRSRLKKEFAGEQKDLGDCATDLRATIVQLRGRPIQRLKRWIHFSSWQVALCCALLLYASVVCWLVAMFDFPSDSPAWINHVKSYLDSSIVWKP